MNYIDFLVDVEQIFEETTLHSVYQDHLNDQGIISSSSADVTLFSDMLNSFSNHVGYSFYMSGEVFKEMYSEFVSVLYEELDSSSSFLPLSDTFVSSITQSPSSPPSNVIDLESMDLRELYSYTTLSYADDDLDGLDRILVNHDTISRILYNSSDGDTKISSKYARDPIVSAFLRVIYPSDDESVQAFSGSSSLSWNGIKQLFESASFSSVTFTKNAYISSLPRDLSDVFEKNPGLLVYPGMFYHDTNITSVIEADRLSFNPMYDMVYMRASKMGVRTGHVILLDVELDSTLSMFMNVPDEFKELKGVILSQAAAIALSKLSPLTEDDLVAVVSTDGLWDGHAWYSGSNIETSCSDYIDSSSTSSTSSSSTSSSSTSCSGGMVRATVTNKSVLASEIVRYYFSLMSDDTWGTESMISTVVSRRKESLELAYSLLRSSVNPTVTMADVFSDMMSNPQFSRVDFELSKSQRPLATSSPLYIQYVSLGAFLNYDDMFSLKNILQRDNLMPVRISLSVVDIYGDIDGLCSILSMLYKAKEEMYIARNSGSELLFTINQCSKISTSDNFHRGVDTNASILTDISCSMGFSYEFLPIMDAVESVLHDLSWWRIRPHMYEDHRGLYRYHSGPSNEVTLDIDSISAFEKRHAMSSSSSSSSLSIETIISVSSNLPVFTTITVLLTHDITADYLPRYVSNLAELAYKMWNNIAWRCDTDGNLLTGGAYDCPLSVIHENMPLYGTTTQEPTLHRSVYRNSKVVFSPEGVFLGVLSSETNNQYITLSSFYPSLPFYVPSRIFSTLPYDMTANVSFMMAILPNGSILNHPTLETAHVHPMRVSIDELEVFDPSFNGLQIATDDNPHVTFSEVVLDTVNGGISQGIFSTRTFRAPSTVDSEESSMATPISVETTYFWSENDYGIIDVLVLSRYDMQTIQYPSSSSSDVTTCTPNPTFRAPSTVDSEESSMATPISVETTYFWSENDYGIIDVLVLSRYDMQTIQYPSSSSSDVTTCTPNPYIASFFSEYLPYTPFVEEYKDYPICHGYNKFSQVGLLSESEQEDAGVFSVNDLDEEGQYLFYLQKGSKLFDSSSIYVTPQVLIDSPAAITDLSLVSYEVYEEISDFFSGNLTYDELSSEQRYGTEQEMIVGEYLNRLSPFYTFYMTQLSLFRYVVLQTITSLETEISDHYLSIFFPASPMSDMDFFIAGRSWYVATKYSPYSSLVSPPFLTYPSLNQVVALTKPLFVDVETNNSIAHTDMVVGNSFLSFEYNSLIDMFRTSIVHGLELMAMTKLGANVILSSNTDQQSLVSFSIDQDDFVATVDVISPVISYFLLKNGIFRRVSGYFTDGPETFFEFIPSSLPNVVKLSEQGVTISANYFEGTVSSECVGSDETVKISVYSLEAYNFILVISENVPDTYYSCEYTDTSSTVSQCTSITDNCACRVSHRWSSSDVPGNGYFEQYFILQDEIANKFDDFTCRSMNVFSKFDLKYATYGFWFLSVLIISSILHVLLC
ncbi:hypothetical protein ADUPG1_011010 [Aduncisulcus paluster]|uniref:Uncharacterized protein n=1 Tax=Aduncisulcus paluster TaxID=2918883 RepID=A0ABQ5JTT7_9EUKA|nr:hypothetical protein ADUPG1_011010 [Aduncisulcus paluster]